MDNPKVSILIPCYNSSKWIAETLQSSLEQTWKNQEIIVVDDGSTDDSLAIAKKYESKNVKVITQQNKGASAARNRALREAQGDFIQYLDADDLLGLDKIERQLKIFEFDSDSNYVVSGEWARFFQKKSDTVFTTQALFLDMSPVEWLVTAWQNNLMMPNAAWLVPRNVADSAGMWNENMSLNDDGEYFCRIILASKEVKFCTGAKFYYRSGISGSLSGSKSRRAWESAYLSMDLNTNNLLAVENSDRTRYASACYWQFFVFMAYPQAPDLITKAEENIRFLGGCDLKPEGGAMFKIIREVLGWKLAMQLQKFYYRYRYKK